MLKITFWDVEHGNACYIETPNGTKIAVDMGVSNAGLRARFSPIDFLREQMGVTSLDALIITHPHRDHLDDIFSLNNSESRVLSRPKHLTEEQIYAANPDGSEDVIKSYLALSRRYSSPVADTDNPYLPINNGGVAIDLFFPTQCSPSNLNNHSIVTVVAYAGRKIILPGDNEEPSWQELLNNQEFREAIGGADILAASHHGREVGYCADLFRHFTPHLVVISDGPTGDTSATGRYSSQCSGHPVYNWHGQLVDATKKCVTTRANGIIQISINNDGKVEIFVTK